MGRFDDLRKAINDKYKGKYATIASDANAFAMDRLPTGILGVDAITYGGLPLGKIIIFWGEWSSAKTFTALKSIARAQRTCRKCLAFMSKEKERTEIINVATGEIIMSGATAADVPTNMATIDRLVEKNNIDEKGLTDEEKGTLKSLRAWLNKSPVKGLKIHAQTTFDVKCPKCGGTEGLACVMVAIEDFDQSFARMAGVNLPELLVVRAEYAEQAIDISAEVIRSGKCDLMVVDSLAAMTPTKEIEESSEKAQQGLMARLLNKAFRRWAAGQTAVDVEGDDDTRKPTIILINQVRQKIGILYGSPDVLPGGKGQTFANSLLLRFRGAKYTQVEDTGETTARLICVRVDKSKVSPPKEEAEFVMWLKNYGGNPAGSTSEAKVVVGAALKEGVIERVKNSYHLLGAKYTSQKAIVAKMLADDMFLNTVRTKVLDSMIERKLRA